MEHISKKMGEEHLRKFNFLYNELLNIMSEYIYDKEDRSDDKNA